jgi:hypothetical protein
VRFASAQAPTSAKGKATSKGGGRVIRVLVQRGAKVEFGPEDARAILREVSRLINAEYRESHPPRELPVFQLVGNQPTVPSIPPLDAAFLARAAYSRPVVNAIRKSEKDGAFGQDAIDAVLSKRHADYFEVNLVREIDAHQCGDVSPIALEQQQSNREDHMAGCSWRPSSTSIVELQNPKEPVGPAYDEWVRREAVLWAHEICHLLGLHDLQKRLRNLLPPPRLGVAGYLMIGPCNPFAYQLLPLEGDVIAAYPNNDGEAMRLKTYLDGFTPPPNP